MATTLDSPESSWEGSLKCQGTGITTHFPQYSAQPSAPFRGRGSPSDWLQGFLASRQGSGKMLGPWGQGSDLAGCAWATSKSL